MTFAGTTEALTGTKMTFAGIDGARTVARAALAPLVALAMAGQAPAAEDPIVVRSRLPGAFSRIVLSARGGPIEETLFTTRGDINFSDSVSGTVNGGTFVSSCDFSFTRSPARLEWVVSQSVQASSELQPLCGNGTCRSCNISSGGRADFNDSLYIRVCGPGTFTLSIDGSTAVSWTGCFPYGAPTVTPTVYFVAAGGADTGTFVNVDPQFLSAPDMIEVSAQDALVTGLLDGGEYFLQLIGGRASIGAEHVRELPRNTASALWTTHVTLTVGSGAAIVSSPASVSAGNACPASFAVGVAGDGPFTYQWRKDLIPISPAANPSASTATLLIAAARAADAGSYDCIVSGGCGPATSNPATLSICRADFNCDGAANADDLADMINCHFATPPGGCPQADFNQDGNIDPDDLGDYINTFFGPPC